MQRAGVKSVFRAGVSRPAEVREGQEKYHQFELSWKNEATPTGQSRQAAVGLALPMFEPS